MFCLVPGKSAEEHLMNFQDHFPNSVWPGLCLTQLCSYTSSAQTLFTLHSPQQSNWHIISQFTSYSVECDALMGLHHWRFIWINTQIPPSVDLNKLAQTTFNHYAEAVALHTDLLQIIHIYCDVFFSCFFVPSLCVLCMSLLCCDDWLMGLRRLWCSDQSRSDWLMALRLLTMMTFKWSWTRWNWGLQEIPSPYLLHWKATPLRHHVPIKWSIQSNLYCRDFLLAGEQ